MEARENLDLVGADPAVVHGMGEPVNERPADVTFDNGEGIGQVSDDPTTHLHRTAKRITEARTLRFVPRPCLGKIGCRFRAVQNTHTYSLLRRRS